MAKFFVAKESFRLRRMMSFLLALFEVFRLGNVVFFSFTLRVVIIRLAIENPEQPAK